eukprot:PITA_06274
MTSIISLEQTDFIEGRQIMDGLVVSQEVSHTLKKKKEPCMMLKLDLSKAYHRLRWKYVDAILQTFGFYSRWVKWVLSMVSTPNFSILLNGTPTAPFNASQGLRQGDPLSPFLFIIAAERLGRYIKKELRERNVKGLCLWGNGIPVTHQQFVDDIMIFCKVSLHEVQKVKEILEIFMAASGTEINKEKSSAFIFNSPEIVKNHLIRILGFRKGELPTKYLGTMLDISLLRVENWQPIIEKLKSRLENWTFRSLNIVARKFLWGGPKQQKKWALCSWNRLTRLKEEGGLRIRDPATLNQVLAAKLWWRWMQGGKDLWKEIWTLKYNMPLATEEITRKDEMPRGSGIWELACQSRDIINKHDFWEIRNGGIEKFWEEAWQQREKLIEVQEIQNIQREAQAKGLILVKYYGKEGGENELWREWKGPEEWGNKIEEEKKERIRNEMNSRRIKYREGPDILRWGENTKGTFSLKEAYTLKIKKTQEAQTQDWSHLWKNRW